MFGEGEFERSAFFNEIVRPNNTFHATGLWHDAPDVSVRLIACRPKQTGDFSDAELQPLEQVFAHLRRAVTMHHRLRTSEDNASGLAAAVDRMSDAAVMLDAAGRVLIVNARASEILDQRSGLALAADELHASSPPLTARLRDAVAAAMTTGTERRLALPRAGRLPLLLDIVPLWRLGLREPGLRAPHTAVFLREPDAPLRIDRTALIETFGLTRREGDIVCLLAEGLGVNDIAARLHLQPDTVRQNLKSAYGKTHVHNQAALVALARGFAR
jgi:DNA-binding CsgD family transcriptional regulator